MKKKSLNPLSIFIASVFLVLFLTAPTNGQEKQKEKWVPKRINKCIELLQSGTADLLHIRIRRLRGRQEAGKDVGGLYHL